MKLISVNQARKKAAAAQKQLDKPIAPYLIPARIKRFTDLGFSNLEIYVKGALVPNAKLLLESEGYDVRVFLDTNFINVDKDEIKESLIYSLEVMW